MRYLLIILFIITLSFSCKDNSNSSKAEVESLENNDSQSRTENDQNLHVEEKLCSPQIDEFSGKEVYVFVDEQPSYEGGTMALMTYLIENINLKQEDVNDYTRFSFTLQFIVDVDGSIIFPRILKVKESDLTMWEKRILESLKNIPKWSWSPGKCKGQAVPVLITMPLNIRP